MATTLLEYFNELRDQNPFSWVKDSEITAVEPGHAEMTLQTNETEYCNFPQVLILRTCGFSYSASPNYKIAI